MSGTRADDLHAQRRPRRRNTRRRLYCGRVSARLGLTKPHHAEQHPNEVAGKNWTKTVARRVASSSERTVEFADGCTLVEARHQGTCRNASRRSAWPGGKVPSTPSTKDTAKDLAETERVCREVETRHFQRMASCSITWTTQRSSSRCPW